MSLSIDSMKSRANEIIKKAQVDYFTLKEVDKNKKQSTLNPGETLGFPNLDGFYFSEYRDECNNILSGYRSELCKMLDEVKAEIKTRAAEPPTTEQANLLTALSIGKPTEEELYTALERHSGNYATYSAIQRIATNNEYHFNDNLNPLNDLICLQNSLSHDTDSLYMANAEQGLNPVARQFVEYMENLG